MPQASISIFLPSDSPPACCHFHPYAPQVLLVADDAFKASIRNPYGENIYACKDGVTPPMRKARQRHFKPAITLPAPHMQEAVRDITEILAGRCVCCCLGVAFWAATVREMSC